MRVFGDSNSGNCLKVKYTADKLGLPYEWIEVDISKGATRTPEFLKMNPMAQVPVVELAGGRHLAQSNAIIRYLAAGTALLPGDKFAQAKIDELLFWEQYSHEPCVAVCRYQMVYLKKAKDERDPQRVTRGEAALDFMDSWLRDRDWFANSAFSIADISLLAYTRLAEEGGFDLSTRPAVKAWIAQSERELGLPALALQANGS